MGVSDPSPQPSASVGHALSAPFVGALMAAVLWGFGGVLADLTTCSGLTLAFYRLWLGTVIYVLALRVSGHWISWKTLRASWLGGLLLAGDFVFFFSAVKDTSIVIVSVIGALQPALVFLAARRMFNERLVWRDMALMAVALTGVVATVLGAHGTGHNHAVGDLCAIATLLCWSGYWVVSKRARVDSGSVQYSASVMVIAALVVTPITLSVDHGFGHVRTIDWFWIGLITLVPGSGHLIMNWAHRFLAASLSSVVGNLSNLVAAAVAVPILGQSLSVTQIIGGLVGLAAALSIAARHHADPASPIE